MRISSLYTAISLLCLVTALPFHSIASTIKPTKDNPLLVQKDRQEVLIAGYVQARKYNEAPALPYDHVKNWHAVVWEGGKVNKGDILFVSYADDSSVYEALAGLGAVAGNNLTPDTWEKRGLRHHREPNRKVEGTPIEVFISWEGAPRAYSLEEVVEDPGGKGVLLKFGGNQDLIPIWKSGCIVCLYSCPGGKISNAAYTANDYVFRVTHFTAREEILPPDGTEVIITLSLKRME